MKKTMSLRETKYAKTKLALLDSAVALVGRNKAFDEISVVEICANAGVSYATFFNYFEKKADLLIYFIQLWSVDVSHRAQKIAAARGGLKAIEEIFDYTARLAESDPVLLGEIIAAQARRSRMESPAVGPLTRAEKKIRFPDLDESTEVAETGLQPVLSLFLKQAVRRGEISKRVNSNELVLALSAIFFGVPVALGAGRGVNLRGHYKRQLQLIWAAAKRREAE